MSDSVVVNFRAPRNHKRALDMIAADLQTTTSDLLREHLEDMIKEYRDGFFYQYTARDDVQLVVDNAHEFSK